MQMTLTIVAESPSELVTVLAALQGAGIGTPVQLQAGSVPSVAAAAAVANDRDVPAPSVVEAVAAAGNAVPEEAPRPRGRPPKSAAMPKPEPKPQPSKLRVVPAEPEVIEPPKEAPREVSMLDVRRALTEYLQANSETEAAALLAKHGHTDRLSRLDPKYYAAVYDAAVTPAAKDEGAAPFDDNIPDLGRA